jgi:hypothetical protein
MYIDAAKYYADDVDYIAKSRSFIVILIDNPKDKKEIKKYFDS